MTRKLHPSALAAAQPKQKEEPKTDVEKIVAADPGYNTDALTINVSAGDISSAVNVAAERLAAHPHLYSYGDDIVQYDEDRKALFRYPRHEDMLRLVVEQAGIFMSYSTTKQKWVPYPFTPKALIHPVCQALVPRLRKLSALEPLTEHRILSSGEWTPSANVYEPQLERFLLLEGVAPPPELPGLKEARETLHWFLSSEFRFLDEPHIERCKAALAVTSVVDFITGSTIPVFIVTAASVGSGKTELARTCIELAGHGGDTTSYTNNRAEFLKVLEPSVRCGKRTLFYDNVVGHISHPELERLVTAFGRPANIRELGMAKVTDVPFRSAIWFTTNGATVTPDLRRRAYSIALEHPNHGYTVEESLIHERLANHEFWFSDLRLCVLALTQHALRKVQPAARTWQNLVRAFWGSTPPAIGKVQGEEDVVSVAGERGEDTMSLEDILMKWPDGVWYASKHLYNGMPDCVNTDCQHEELVQAVFEFVESMPMPPGKTLHAKKISLGKKLSKLAASRYTINGRRLVMAQGAGHLQMFTVQTVTKEEAR